MGFEVEVKYRAANHKALERKLLELGATSDSEALQEDTYLSHPSRDFAKTNEAFRIRRIGESNRITYKGPRRAGPTKTRQEIEIPFAPGAETHEDLRQLLINLGFSEVLVVRKTRQSFHLTFQGHPFEVALDRAEGLGDFAEVETLANTEADLPNAQAAVLSLASRLGLSEVEPRSYLRMALTQAGIAI
jgi:adenylate cyclase, class 2